MKKIHRILWISTLFLLLILLFSFLCSLNVSKKIISLKKDLTDFPDGNAFENLTKKEREKTAARALHLQNEVEKLGRTLSLFANYSDYNRLYAGSASFCDSIFLEKDDYIRAKRQLLDAFNDLLRLEQCSFELIF